MCVCLYKMLLTLGAHAQRGLQYSVCLSVSQSVSQCVSDNTLQVSVVKGTLKFRHQRSVNDTLQCFDSWILLTMLGSRDMAKFVSQEAYNRASLPEISAHVINLLSDPGGKKEEDDQSHARDRTRALLSRAFPVCELSRLFKQAA